MNGQHFVGTLKKLGYPDADQLNPYTFEWMFENAALAPFLEWFCTNLDSTNVVSNEKWKRFQNIPQDSILDGKQLNDNLKIRKEHNELPDEEKLVEELEKLEQDVIEEEKICFYLGHQRDMQSVQQTKIVHRSTQLDKLLSRRKHSYDKVCDEVETRDLRLNKSLQILSADVRNVIDMYSEATGENDTFLYKQCLDKYRESEQNYMRGLKNFSKKAFNENTTKSCANISEKFSTSSKNTSVFLQGEDTQELKHCEMKRLYKVYLKTELSKIVSNAELEDLRAKYRFITKQHQLMHDGHFPYPTDVTSLGQSLRDIHLKFSRVDKQCQTLIDGELSQLIQLSTETQRNKVLASDCNLKLAKQDIFISKQKKLIDFLCAQNSRVVFMNTALQLDLSQHQETKKLLNCVKDDLKRMLQRHEQQLSLWKSIEEEPLVPPLCEEESSRLDAEDEFTQRLYSALVLVTDKDTHHMFVTYQDLLEAAKNLIRRNQTLHNALSIEESNQKQNLMIMEKRLTSVDDLLSSSTTTHGTPNLTPEPVSQLMNSLESKLSTLEQAMKHIIRETTEKDNKLKLCPFQRTERELFKYFFNDPDKLRKTIESLNQRLETKTIKPEDKNSSDDKPKIDHFSAFLKQS